MSATASVLPHAACAAACLVWTALVLRVGRAAAPLALACGITALWAAAVALGSDAPLDGLAGALEVLRTGSYILLLLALCRRLGGLRTASRLTWRVALAAGLAGLLLLGALLPLLATAVTLPAVGPLLPILQIGLALATLLLVENVWRNADETARWHVNLLCIALGGFAAFDLLLYSHAALSGAFSGVLLDARAVITSITMGLLVVAAARNRRWQAEPPVSREVVFHSATLMVAGAFLLGVGVLGEGLRQSGLAWGEAAQAGLMAVAVLGLVVAASTASLRSRLRRAVVDHFFAARHDYRREWLRCVAALSAPDGDASIRAIRAVADAVDSPAGVLLLRRDESGAATTPCLDPAGSWNRPALPVPALAGSFLLASLGPDGDRVAVFRPGAAEAGAAELEATYGPVWLAVPLLHHRQGLLGVVLLAPPRAPFPLDDEVLDLLRILGREVAMFLAERRAAEQLADGRKLAEYAQRFAFVAHDLKTVSYQLGMLLANAESNIHDREFQQDMLLTAGAAVTRMRSLIARLPAEEEGDAPAAAPASAPSPAVIDPRPVLRALAARRSHPVQVIEDDRVSAVAISGDAFDSAVTHLLDNAVEASGPDEPVTLRLWKKDGRPMLDIADRGIGMTDRFVREMLFRPLSTTKKGGNGIGAWQARELLRAAGGDLTVISRPGVGTTMRITLPPTTAADPAPAASAAAQPEKVGA
ncbi:XrtA/PEP-CTERM system histidine kinase PrsK [Muricoccus radiodurans]|uniref:XrtA/PEP-CTERM system histidine kinase PrsK n=1 Tax=Muricoccus radiodurans TaxID=2231721 RepID=UPI003CF07E0A